jgi:hypothetical protein
VQLTSLQARGTPRPSYVDLINICARTRTWSTISSHNSPPRSRSKLCVEGSNIYSLPASQPTSVTDSKCTPRLLDKVKKRVYHTRVSLVSVGRNTERPFQVDSIDPPSARVALSDQVAEILLSNLRFSLDFAYVFLLLLKFLHPSLQVDIELLSWEA